MALTPTGPNAEQIKYWNEISGPKWVALHEIVDRQIRPLGQAAMDAAGIGPGDRVLDIGCGCGATTLEIARRVGPQGEAVGADVSGQVVTVLQVGAEGGDVTLFGRRRSDGEWQFARVTNDQSELLLGEVDVAVSPTPAIDSLKWVESWDEALQLMDRYPWARLHPVQVQPAFLEQVRLAVDARLVRAPPDRFTEYAREKWDSLFQRAGASARR